MGLLVAAIVFSNQDAWEALVARTDLGSVTGWLAIVFMLIVAGYLILRPLGRAGRADEPAPPPVSM